MTEEKVLNTVLGALIALGVGGVAMMVGVLGDYPRLFMLGAMGLLGSAMVGAGLMVAVLIDAIRGKD